MATLQTSQSVTRVAIVTGAAGDLGKHIAARLADDGFDLAVNDLPSREADLKDLVSTIISKGRKAIAVPGDVSVEQDVQNLVERAASELGSVNVMVSNVGIFKAVPIDQMDVQTWDNIFSVNVRGMMLCYKWAARQMIKQGSGGKLIGGCSVAGLSAGVPLCSAYCASKFAVRGLTQSAATEYAKQGITANAYAPGFIGETSMWHNLRDQAEAILGIPKGGFEQHALANAIKLGRLGKPEDVAGLISFLASKDSSYITGQTFSCDGGMHIA